MGLPTKLVFSYGSDSVYSFWHFPSPFLEPSWMGAPKWVHLAALRMKAAWRKRETAWSLEQLLQSWPASPLFLVVYGTGPLVCFSQLPSGFRSMEPVPFWGERIMHTGAQRESFFSEHSGEVSPGQSIFTVFCKIKQCTKISIVAQLALPPFILFSLHLKKCYPSSVC